MFHPLRKIPGPWIAALTDQYLIIHDVAGLRSHLIHKLHKKYGPVVRIAPNELSFSSKSAIKDLYGQNTKVTKAPIYGTFPPGIFSMRGKEEHKQRRKSMSPVFSFAHLMTLESVIHEKIDDLLEVIEESEGRGLNMLELFRMLSLDIISLSVLLCG